MFADERRNEIVKLIEAQHTVTVSELMRRYGVSIETIRRDLERLEKNRLLKRVYGGAVSLGKMQQFERLEHRSSQNLPKKQGTAKAVAALIKEGDRIALDSGSTAREIALRLREQFRELTVVTYSPEVFSLLCGKEGFHLIQIGGEYLHDEQTFCGYQAQEMMRGLHVSKGIVCPSAVSLREGISDYVPQIVPLQREIMEISDEVIIAADSSKFEKAGAYRLSPLSPGFWLATDGGVPEYIVKSYQEKGMIFCIQREDER